MAQLRRVLLVVGLATLNVAAPARAQVMLDWPIRTSGETEALSRGAAAAFANPAGVAALPSRGELLAVDLASPEEIGVGGLALAGALRLPFGFSAGVSWTHITTGPIPLTRNEPTGTVPQQHMEIAEDRVALAMARPVALGLEVGGTLGWQSASFEVGSASSFHGGGGARFRAGGPLAAELGASIDFAPSRARWLLGAGVALPVHRLPDMEMRVSWGMEGGQSLPETQSLALGASWRGRFHATAGMERETANDAGGWEPALAGSVRFGRYELGVVRETLANGFGAAYFYRFGVRL